MEGASAGVRCFVAIELPEGVKRDLASTQQALSTRIRQSIGAAAERAVRWVNPESIHLTLKFLGNVATHSLPALEDALRRELSGRPSCTVTIGGLGMFPNERRPRVIWVGVGGEIEVLAGIQRQVEVATVPLGFPAEQRGFSPHLTLARVREDLGAGDRRALGTTFSSVGFAAVHTVIAREVSLMRSELRRAGARYSRLAAVELKP